ncbi:unnamed protein product [Callosobruchus maculatus]|uniref:Major facilitator superfamily (MFS) profile domain-containing protein n=1 Tax=Callosobruchus maculatus TaxID=64391 RepID=A0A653CBG7_CALMS|nr:unnamed protein product [Callosobruchus maculatus]
MAVAIKRYGTKKILAISMSINCITCMMIPFTADKFGSYGMMACRALQGFSQAAILPALYNVLSQWAPPAERSFLGALGGSGALLGVIVTMPVTGLLCSSSWGWPSTFYLNGTLGLVWLVLWIFLAADTPYSHKFITESEKKYITSSLGHKGDTKRRATPWKKILTSLPFLGITITQCGCSFGDNISFIEMPSYINKILKYDMNANGAISSLPFLANFTLGFIFGYCADAIIRKRIMSLENCRKMYVGISTIGPALCLVSLSFLPENSTVLSCMMMVLHQSFSAAYQGGISMSYLDISPNFCGILMSITNAVSTICDIVVPLLVQVIVTDEGDKSQWRVIFLIAAAMYVFSTISFTLLGSGKVQSWDYAKSEQETCEEEQYENCSVILNKL